MWKDMKTWCLARQQSAKILPKSEESVQKNFENDPAFVTTLTDGNDKTAVKISVKT
jgi:hypothetical protein